MRLVPSALVPALAALAVFLFTAPARAAIEDFAIDSFEAELSTYQAGAHPDLFTSFSLAQDPATSPNVFGLKAPFANARNITIELPPGLSGNPEVVSEQCEAADLVNFASPGGGCPNASQIGVTTIHAHALGLVFREPVYMMEPPGGDVVARFGFVAGIFPTFIDTVLDPERGNALTARITSAPAAGLVQADTTIWGVPADPSHDTERQTIQEAFNGASSSVPRPPGGAPQAFMSGPTSCGPGKEATVRITPWGAPDLEVSKSASLPAFTGCELLDFSPQIDLQPTASNADSPSGMDADLFLPQNTITDPDGRVEAHLKTATVTLPEGMSLNPSAADGLVGCTTAQIGLISESPIRFNAADPTCPDASKIGTVEITTPVLPDPIDGSVYVAEQDDNPFHSLLAGYIVAQGQGLTLKLAGRFDPDPATGQITAVFDDNPQQPFSGFKLHFKGGSRGVLVTPPTCGKYTISSTLTPWSGTPPVNRTSTFTVDRSPTGGSCQVGNPALPANPADRAVRPFAPQLAAGSVTPIAGSYSPFVLRLTRQDGEQELTRVGADLPPGVIGKIAGVAQCSDAAINSIPTGLGTGAAELNSPSCPANTRVGYTQAGAGAGSQLTYIPGTVYLAGPYKGAPLSLAIVTPAVTGPFDLGNVVVRTALFVDPDDAQLHAVSDPLPTILQGVPLHLRDIRVVMDRENFTLNPTNCNPMQVTGSVGGAGQSLTNPADDISAPISDHFQVGGCGALGFKPKMTLRLRGGTKRGRYPALTATIVPRPGDANIASVSLALPRSEFLANEHIRTVCTRPDFAADRCPAGAIYGEATVQTPLLDDPLTGHAYLRSSNNLLPDLVTDLRGPASLPIKLETSGRTDSVGGGIRNTFDFIPDAPFSKATVALLGGAKGLLINSRDICKRTYRATVRYTAHNGDTFTARPKLRAQCKKKRGKKRKGKRRGHRRASLSAVSTAR